MKTLLQFLLFIAGTHYLLASTPAPATSATISVAIDPTKVVGQVPTNYLGVCLGSEEIHTFYPGNQSLINLYRTTGMHHLSLKDAPYTHAQLDNLFAFARLADVKILLMMKMDIGDVDIATHLPSASFQSAVNQSIDQIAYIITKHYLLYIDCFCMANEPDYYGWDYAKDYEQNWSFYVKGIQTGLASYKANPTSSVTPLGPVMFCGPSTANNKPPTYFLNFEKAFSSQGSRYADVGKYVSFATQHLYLIGSSSGERKAGHTVLHDAQKMILIADSNNISAYYFLCGGNGSAKPRLSHPLMPYRQEECGAYSQHGIKGASNTYSASLWSLEYEYWWAAHGCLGVDYCQALEAPYSTYASTTNGSNNSVTVYGNAYGMLAFKLGTAATTLISATVGSATPLPAGSALDGTYGVSAYATKATDGSVYVTIFNKDNGSDGQSGIPSKVSIDLPTGFTISAVQSISLTTSLTGGSGNLSAVTTPTGGIYLGGSPINAQGNFESNWSSLTPSHTNSMNVTVPGASVTILKILPMITATGKYTFSPTNP